MTHLVQEHAQQVNPAAKEIQVVKTALLENTAQQLVVPAQIVLLENQVYQARHWNQIVQPVKQVCTVVLVQHAKHVLQVNSSSILRQNVPFAVKESINQATLQQLLRVKTVW